MTRAEISATSPTAPVDREVTLTAPPDFHMPDLSGLLPGTTAKPLPEQRFEVIYYDTGALRLARAGITLRYHRR